MDREMEEVPTMGKSRLGAAASLVIVLLASAILILPPRQAASQQTPQAQATWTPSAACARLDALRAAHHQSQRPFTPGEWEELHRLFAATGGNNGCELDAERHSPPVRWRPEWGPVRTPVSFRKLDFSKMPTPAP